MWCFGRVSVRNMTRSCSSRSWMDQSCKKEFRDFFSHHNGSHKLNVACVLVAVFCRCELWCSHLWCVCSTTSCSSLRSTSEFPPRRRSRSATRPFYLRISAGGCAVRHFIGLFYFLRVVSHKLYCFYFNQSQLQGNHAELCSATFDPSSGTLGPGCRRDIVVSFISHTDVSVQVTVNEKGLQQLMRLWGCNLYFQPSIWDVCLEFWNVSFSSWSCLSWLHTAWSRAWTLHLLFTLWLPKQRNWALPTLYPVSGDDLIACVLGASDTLNLNDQTEIWH